jgi:hypothetical protein
LIFCYSPFDDLEVAVVFKIILVHQKKSLYAEDIPFSVLKVCVNLCLYRARTFAFFSLSYFAINTILKVGLAREISVKEETSGSMHLIIQKNGVHYTLMRNQMSR